MHDATPAVVGVLEAMARTSFAPPDMKWVQSGQTAGWLTLRSCSRASLGVRLTIPIDLELDCGK
jgi:hypothetical protein